MPNIPLFNAQGKSAQSDLMLTPLAGDLVQIVIGHEFAGRDVEEELELATLKMIGGDEVYKCNALLGLNFQTDGQEITGSVGAGSGNFGFLIQKADWNAAVNELESEQTTA